MKTSLKILVFTFAILLNSLLKAQQDSIPKRSIPPPPARNKIPTPDSLNNAAQPLLGQMLPDSTAKKPFPRHKKALILAVLIPGAGQIYNKRYWKLPILYTGAAAAAWFWATNQSSYREFKDMYEYQYDLLKEDPTHFFIYESENTGLVYTSINQLSTERDNFRRYRDFAIAGSLALYAISILDAYVDAHLQDFDLSPNLSLSVKPYFYTNNNTIFTPGLSIGLNFKNNRNSFYKLY